MKILIAYFSQTGNTEKVARAIKEEVSSAHDAAIRRVEEIGADDLESLGLVFIGSPIHAGGLAKPAADFIASLSGSDVPAAAGFVTHSAPAYQREGFEKGLEGLEKGLGQKGIKYLGCFDCQGKLDPKIQPFVQQKFGHDDETWSEMMSKTDPHPDEEDLARAAVFARETLEKL